MYRFLLHLCCLLCVSLVVQGQFPQIVGDATFTRQVQAALRLLQTKAPQTLSFVNQFTKRIQQYHTTGMCAYCNPPTYQLSNAVAGNMEPYWLASTISHDSYHSYMYQYYKSKYNKEPPANAWTGFDAERECNKYQMQVLKTIGAPQYLIDHMAKQNGTHCDLNGDGVCDDKDYKLRPYRR